MYYAIFSASYSDECLREEFGAIVEMDTIGIEKELIDKISNWNKAYKEIIPLSSNERKEKSQKINLLDREGIALKQIIEEQSNEQCKIKYYSEGLLRYLY